jgi:predicted Zn-dependent protease
MSFQDATRGLFESVAGAGFSDLRPGEALNLDLAAEDQIYIRFNRARVRQATAVAQRTLSGLFQSGGRQIAVGIDLSGQIDQDRASIRTLVEQARRQCAALPEDPFLAPIAHNGGSAIEFTGQIAPVEHLIECIAEETENCDFVGLLASGPQLRGNANSEGQNHWYATESFFLDYSLYTTDRHGEPKAVKAAYAGRDWSDDRFRSGLSASRNQLARLRGETRSLAPGHYRTYFSPAAVNDLIGMLSWGALSYGAWRKGRCALRRLIEGTAELSPLFTLSENFGLGLAPAFNSLGEVVPERIIAIQDGKHRNFMVSSRSAREYGVPGNGAEPEGWAAESLRSPEVATGALDEGDALAALDTGLYVSNLHYLNWSDLLAARVTGMTRYACFWVESGAIVAPIRDLRFDDSLYRVFGSELEALTSQAELIVETDTYRRRALGGSKVPGLLVRDFRFAA